MFARANLSFPLESREDVTSQGLKRFIYLVGGGVGRRMCSTQKPIVMTDFHSYSDLGGHHWRIFQGPSDNCVKEEQRKK